jgi:4-hydroxy-3-methylbut-2-enyl diphosphate reductase
MISRATSIGITAGASAPEVLVERIVDRITRLSPGVTSTDHSGVAENITFSLPKELN